MCKAVENPRLFHIVFHDVCLQVRQKWRALTFKICFFPFSTEKCGEHPLSQDFGRWRTGECVKSFSQCGTMGGDRSNVRKNKKSQGFFLIFPDSKKGETRRKISAKQMFLRNVFFSYYKM